MYDVNLVRVLCEKIAGERDSFKSQDLCALLHAVIQENDEEIALRLKFLKKKYNIAFENERHGS